jgi:hypothetical protein
MDLNQLLDLATMTGVDDLARPARDFKVLRESHKRSSKLTGMGLLDWFSIGRNGPNLASDFRKQYPRVDISEFETCWFAIHGVVSRSEKLIGDFWVGVS